MPTATALDPNLLARLARLKLVSVSKLTDRGGGERLAGRGGSSIDFVDYRDYAPGDDLRHVDWNAFARLQRPYLKQFRKEEDRHLLILVDASASMAFAGKLELARQLAAAFAVMGLHHGDKVSVWSCGGPGGGTTGGTVQRLSPLAGRQWQGRAFAAIDAIPAAAGERTIAGAVTDTLARHHGQGIALLLSDFLGDENHRPALTRLRASGLEPWAVQILSAAELDPAIDGDLRLVDCETGETLDVSAAGDLLGLYHQHRQALQEALSTAATGRRGRFTSLTADQPLAEILARLQRSGWIQ